MFNVNIINHFEQADPGGNPTNVTVMYREGSSGTFSEIPARGAAGEYGSGQIENITRFEVEVWETRPIRFKKEKEEFTIGVLMDWNGNQGITPLVLKGNYIPSEKRLVIEVIDCSYSLSIHPPPADVNVSIGPD